MEGGEGQVSGFWSQKSGVRSQNEEHLLSADCLLPTVFEGGGMERAFGRHGSSGQDVTADRERKN